jgi:hypothetical protein
MTSCIAAVQIRYLPVEGGVEPVKVVFSLGSFFLGSSLSSWTWSLVASPEVVIKNTDTDHSTGLGIL